MNFDLLLKLGTSIILAVFIPAVPALVIAVFRSKRNDKKICLIFERIDEIKNKKADKDELKSSNGAMNMKIEKITDKLQNYAEKVSENMGRFAASMDRLESMERRLEKRIEKIS